MNIKDKYTNDMNSKSLDPEFKKNLAEMMQKQFDSSDSSADEIASFIFTDEFVEDMKPDIIHADSRLKLRVFRYIASAAAALVITSSAVMFFRSNAPEHNYTQEAVVTTVTVNAYADEASVTEAAFSQTAAESVTTTVQSITTSAVTTLINTAPVSDTEAFSEKAGDTEIIRLPVTGAPEASVSESASASHEPSVTAAVTTAAETTSLTTTVTEPSVPPSAEVTEGAGKIPNIVLNEYGLLTVSADNIIYKGDGVYDVYYKCSSFIDLSALTFCIDYDRDNITLIGHSLIAGDEDDEYRQYSATYPDLFMYYHNELGKLPFSSKILAKYTFRFNDDAPDGDYTFSAKSDAQGLSATIANMYSSEEKVVYIIDGEHTRFTPGKIHFERSTSRTE